MTVLNLDPWFWLLGVVIPVLVLAAPLWWLVWKVRSIEQDLGRIVRDLYPKSKSETETKL